ncbi:MAG: alpha/beta hydrolase [Promethearchaeati archaeon SRVP18_Atabeyarchaeia-1]
MPFIDVKGLKTFYESKGRGKPLLLIHGAGGSSGYWGVQLSKLSRNFMVIAIDLPGHGKSDHLKERASIQQYAEHVAVFMKQVRLDRAFVLGHSMGGAVAQELAIERPELVEKLIIVDSGARFPGQGGFADRVRSQGAEFGIQILNMLLSEKTVSDQKKMAFVMKHLMQSPSFDINILADDFQAVAGVDLGKRLSEIAAPTLIIHGADDLLPLSMAQFLQQSIKGSKLEVISDSGHMPMLEQPEKFNEAILKFLRG